MSKECYDIIIQAGQSNSVGCGIGPVDMPYEQSEKIWYMNNDFTISCGSEVVEDNEIYGTFVLSFAREYVKKGMLQTGRKLLILRCAVGGTGFLDNRWNLTGDLYHGMMTMIAKALSMNVANRLVGFLWHQGETDAIFHASYEMHYNHLKQLLCSVCEKFQVPNLPFVAGDFVYHWKNENQEICEPVVRAIQDLCRDYGNGAFVRTDGLKSNMQEMDTGEDNIHFSRKSCYELGERYFEAYCKLVQQIL